MKDILNNASDTPKDDNNKNIREEAYNLVDKALLNLSKKDGEWLPAIFDIYTTSGQIAKDILINNNFITLRGYDIKKTIVDITELGLSIVELGGYRQFLAVKNETLGSRIEKENLELQQLKSNVSLLKNQLADYNKTKTNLKYSTIANVIISIVAVIELILLLKGCK